MAKKPSKQPFTARQYRQNKTNPIGISVKSRADEYDKMPRKPTKTNKNKIFLFFRLTLIKNYGIITSSKGNEQTRRL